VEERRSFAELAVETLKRALEADGLEQTLLIERALAFHRLAIEEAEPACAEDRDEPDERQGVDDTNPE
jgi:hypothetical protein